MWFRQKALDISVRQAFIAHWALAATRQDKKPRLLN